MLKRHLLLCLAAALLLSSCAKVRSLWTHEPAKPSYHVTLHGGLSTTWLADVDQRKPAAPSGFSIPLVAKSSKGTMIVAGGQDKRVHVYSEGGSERHRITLSAACDSGAAQLANGLVVLADVEGMLYGIDIVAGKISWQLQMTSFMQGHPVVVGDKLLVQTADDRIYAISQDGNKLWSYADVQTGLGMRAGSSPIVAGSTIYAVMNNGDAVALNGASGDLLWKQQLILNNDAPVLSELRIPLAEPLLIPAERAGRMDDVLAISIYQGDLIFLSALDGNRLFERKLSLRNAPVLAGNQLYVADSDGAILALDPASGQTMWKKQISDAELAGPLLWMDSLWVADAKGRVFRLGMDGKVEADIRLPGRIDRKPVAVTGGVLVRTDRGVLYQLR